VARGIDRTRERAVLESFQNRRSRGARLRVTTAAGNRVQDRVIHTVMHENILVTASRLSDDALDARLKRAADCEHGGTVELVACLAILLTRKKHLGQGWGNVYTYCCDVLHLSHDAAYNRVAAARAVRRFPVVLDHLAARFVNVTTIKVLRPVLTAANHLDVLAEAKHRSRRECDLIVARLKPKPDVRSTIRRLPTPSGAPAPSIFDVTETKVVGTNPTTTAVNRVSAPTTKPAVIAPLTPERYRMEFTASKQMRDKLLHLQDLLCREVPDGDPAVIFERALDALTTEVEKKKRAATAKPRAPRAMKEGSRDIPAHVTREVWRRDGNRCAFVGTHGRCAERRFLDLHHVQPFADGGPPTIANISVRCRAHNVYESELVFGVFNVASARERRANYVASREYAPFQNGG
jgi:hypothetical protein